MKLFKIARPIIVLVLAVSVSGCPKTMVDRAIEARSVRDIAKDNEIVLKTNAVMADLGVLNAATTVYEQRLLITGLFEDKALYDHFKSSIQNLEGVRTLCWHVAYLNPNEQRKRERLLSWDDVLVLATKAEGRLIATRGVADVNFRVAADAFGAVYLMGRARSQEELDKAVARVRDGEGVRKLVNYAFVRP